MPKQTALLRRAAVAALATAPLLLPLHALAQIDQPAGAASVAKPQPKKHKQSAGAAKEAVGAPLDLTAFATNTALAAAPGPSPAPAAPQASAPEPEDELCPNGRTSYVPPCVGTYPQADPNYHGPGGR